MGHEALLSVFYKNLMAEVSGNMGTSLTDLYVETNNIGEIYREYFLDAVAETLDMKYAPLAHPKFRRGIDLNLAAYEVIRKSTKGAIYRRPAHQLLKVFRMCLRYKSAPQRDRLIAQFASDVAELARAFRY